MGRSLGRRLRPKDLSGFCGVWPYFLHYSVFILYHLKFVDGIVLDPALELASWSPRIGPFGKRPPLVPKQGQ